MRERLVALGLAAAALGLFYVLFFTRPQTDEAEALPLSTESRPAGYLAIWQWLTTLHVPAASLRYRYDRLPGLLPRPTGNVLLMTLPQQEPAHAGELVRLQRWVEAGNTLLIMAALDDTPGWALGVEAVDPVSPETLEQLTGLRFRGGLAAMFRARRDLEALTRHRLDIQPRGEQALVAGVRHITALSDLPLGSAELQSQGDVLPLELASRSDNRTTTLWLLRRGAGQILLSSVASPFSNAAVALDDNARLLSNIIAWCRGDGGTVVFDDAHQGATAYYDGKAFFADPRLHRTIGWILLLWLAFVLGALPLRAVRRSWEPLDETAYMEGSARYFAAVVPPGEAAQRLIERFLEAMRAAVPDQQELAQRATLWARFDAHPRVTERQRRDLHTFYEKACAGEHVNLTRLQGLLSQLRGVVE
jgi:hypothetical protein